MKLKFAWVALALTLAVLPLSAQVNKGDWEITAMAGKAWHGAELRDGWTGSLAVGYDFTQMWGLELQTTYADSSVAGLNRNMSTLRLSGLYNIMPSHRTVPYVKFGVGWTAMRPDGFGNVFSGDKQVHLGLGARWFVSPRFALRLEALAVYTHSASYDNTHDWYMRTIYHGAVPPPYPNPPTRYWDSVYSTRDKFMNYEVLFGISFLPKKRHAVEPSTAPYPPAPPPAQETSTPPAPPPPPPPAQAETPVTPPMITVSLDEVVSHFALNKWDIPSSGVPILDAVVAKLNKYPELKVNITGYTDNLDGAAWNATLSERRAESVKKYLMDHGIDAARIVNIEGLGPSNPIGDNKTREGRSENRRAEVKSTAPVQVPAN